MRAEAANVMHESHEPPPALDAEYRALWPIFERSRIPMALIDAEGRYVAVNDAAIAFSGYPREKLIGAVAGRSLAPAEQRRLETAFEELKRTGEYYGDRIVRRADGTDLRVQGAAHASTASGRWLAFTVALSAHLEPDGPELIAAEAALPTQTVAAPGPRLTRREREIVRLVALGAGNREIADRLHVSPETVRSHLRNAMGKANARTRAQLVAIALSERLLEDTDAPPQ